MRAITDKQRLEALISLAVKTGILYVAQDIYDLMKSYFTDNDGIIGSIQIRSLQFVPPGTIMTYDILRTPALLGEVVLEPPPLPSLNVFRREV